MLIEGIFGYIVFHFRLDIGVDQIYIGEVRVNADGDKPFVHWCECQNSTT